MDKNNEKYAELLSSRAEKAVKIIKALVIAAVIAAGVMFIFALIALLAIDDTKVILIGMTVFISVVAALLVAVLGLFIYAKANLSKLKKLDR